jgi:hypothetical protein|tara:strand:- start:344 stop:1090 length:747 start_codon:yes stop_codon:yes gene_type:complete
MKTKLLTMTSPKIIKGDKLHTDYMSTVMYLSPSDSAGGKTICPYAKIAQCEEACLNTAGRGGIFKKGETTNAIQEARKRRTLYFQNNYEDFMTQLFFEINKFKEKAEGLGKLPCVRLNGTSDIQWEYQELQGRNVFETFPDITFYDYTKIPTRNISGIDNYHLTWSYSQANMKYANLFDEANSKGMNIAVVFSKELPEFYRGLKVIDGDKYDQRFLDESNVVVGLKAKGKARKDTSGFVVHNNLIAVA